jgi:hypothetical protein
MGVTNNTQKMNKLIYLFTFFSIVTVGCQEHINGHYIDEYVKLDVASIKDNWDEVYKTFDTIPDEFGHIIFEDILQSINDSSEFKKIWKATYRSHDSITNVLAKRKNRFLDPKNQLSDNSFFFVVEIESPNKMSFAATIFTDIDNGTIGTFIIPMDSIKSITISKGAYIENLKEKLKTSK